MKRKRKSLHAWETFTFSFLLSLTHPLFFCQVKSVFEKLLPKVNDTAPLRVACITGQTPFQREQTQLVEQARPGAEAQSKVDILVATPGRLIDHVNGTGV